MAVLSLRQGFSRRRQSGSGSGMIEALELRLLRAIDVQFVSVTIPIAGDVPVILPGQQVAINVQMKNLGDAFKKDFTVGVQLSPYAMGSATERLAINYGTGNIDLGSVVFSDEMPSNGDPQTATINTTIPANLTPGTYGMVVKLDTNNDLVESDITNNQDGVLDVQVLTAGGVMQLAGTSGDDVFTLTRTTVNKHPHMTVTAGGRTVDYGLGAVTQIQVYGLDGNDTIIGSGALPPLLFDGYDGNDYLAGGDGNDTLIGGANKDTLYGGGGNDRLNGNGGNDKLFGEAGADRLYGYDGNDTLDGGSSNDRLEGGAGVDVMLGEGGDDKFFAKDGAIDQLFGASGHDTANIDATDVLSSIETTSTT